MWSNNSVTGFLLQWYLGHNWRMQSRIYFMTFYLLEEYNQQLWGAFSNHVKYFFMSLMCNNVFTGPKIMWYKAVGGFSYAWICIWAKGNWLWKTTWELSGYWNKWGNMFIFIATEIVNWNMKSFCIAVCTLCDNALIPVCHTGMYWNSTVLL